MSEHEMKHNMQERVYNNISNKRMKDGKFSLGETNVEMK